MDADPVLADHAAVAGLETAVCKLAHRPCALKTGHSSLRGERVATPATQPEQRPASLARRPIRGLVEPPVGWAGVER